MSELDKISEDNLKEAIRKRGIIKGKLTRFGTFFNGFLKNESRNFTELKLRCDKLEVLFNEFDVVQTEVEEFDDSTDQQNERTSFENNFFAIQAAAVDEYENHILLNSSKSTQKNDQFETNLFQLPKINMPEFSGGFENWQSFRDNFTVLVHNKNISAVQKLQYLRLAVKGPAAQLIDCLEIVDVNYQVAWKLLCDRYENKRLIVQSHLSKIFGVSRIEKESAEQLQQFHDIFTRHLGALKAGGEAVEGWSTILVFLATSKLDTRSLTEWEMSRKDTSVPTWEEFEKFICHRCHTLAAVEAAKGQVKLTANQLSSPPVRRSFTTFNDKSNVIGQKCYICKISHELYQCPKFLELRTPDKVKIARAASICLNCLRTGHRASSCRSAGCQKCNKRHNSKLHLEEDEREEAFSNNVVIDHESLDEVDINGVAENGEHSIVCKALLEQTNCTRAKEVAILSTAVVVINDVRKKKITARVLLDSGSQVNLITMKLATKLGYPITKTNMTIRGVAGESCKPIGEISATVKSRVNAFEAKLNFFVLQNVAGTLPSIYPGEEIMSVITKKEYADPELCSTRKIDMILGTQVFFRLLCIGQIRPVGTDAIWQKTVFGWILSGHVTTSPTINYCLSIMSVESESIQEQVQKFWELEEVVTSPPIHKLSLEEKKCEAHFLKTCRREDSGRFTLKLPFKENVGQLGDSRSIAEKRFYAMEHKLEKDIILKEEYVKFMREYSDLGHMTLKPDSSKKRDDLQQVFLPHHAVVRQESTTTKVRVVFDASSKTSSSVSLNDTLMVGPTIQDDLRAILIRFRVHEVVITADIEKMYRQISIHPDCQSYQQILWRESRNEPLKTYDLKTVTFGTSSAPFMAIRTLHHLADCEKKNYDEAARITKRDFYVDDLLTGATSIEKAIELQKSIIEMCKKGGFVLRKWCSNQDELLKSIPNTMQATSHNFNFKEEISTKTLGVRWKPKEDQLHFLVQVATPLSSCTKRKVVSEMARLFDPLGLVSPVIVKAKMFVQQLWKLKLSWDESLPIEYHTAWESYRKELVRITEIQIPRRVTVPSSTLHDLHIFCDASQLAYGACAYLRSVTKNRGVSARLLIAKSRVCPVKATTIPRLELCAALLASKLMTMIRQSLHEVLSFNSITFWSDSSIVLSWINSRESSDSWKTFVANRVEEIRELTSEYAWKHVVGSDNPADHISRGLSVPDIAKCQLWWSGPAWLVFPEEKWPIIVQTKDLDESTERRKEVTVLQVSIDRSIDFMDILRRFSKLERLYRTTAYLFRGVTLKNKRIVGGIIAEEIEKCTKFWIKIVQKSSFKTEITELQNHQTTDKSHSRIKSLTPFLDVDGILRVGGRLQNSNEPYQIRHPIILPVDSHLSELIVESEHRRLIHAGPQQLIASLRRNYWILNIRRLVQKVIFRCDPCYRWRVQCSQQLMGSMPADRVNPSPVFHVCGVDYAGPFKMRYGPQRSKHIFKAYIAIFVCFSTKAVHLEWVDDLTTEAFIATLRCFVARRGKPSKIYSDNGRNFVGAAAQLQTLLSSSKLKQELSSYTASIGIRWSFIPPHSPHMGGLWEAGVKSMKFHLRRSLGENTLSQREANALLTQIEAVLNSRPLVAASDDHNDFEALTPGHFLIGRPLTAVPEPNLTGVKSLKLRWHKVQQIVQHFWHRWRTEYLQSLQKRRKWNSEEPNLQIGDLVLIQEDFETPLAWRRGRILHLHEGTDGLIRVVTIRTEKGEVKRPIHKLSKLPNQK